MVFWAASILALSALTTEAAVPATPGDRMLACVRSNFPAADVVTLSTALDDDQERPPAVMGPVLMRLIAVCGDRSRQDQLPVLLGFGHVLMGGQRDVIAARAGVAEDRRAAFETTIRPFAEPLPVGSDGADFGPDEISDALLAEVRAALVAAGFAVTITDPALRKYMELMARERTVARNLNQILMARR